MSPVSTWERFQPGKMSRGASLANGEITTSAPRRSPSHRTAEHPHRSARGSGNVSGLVADRWNQRARCARRARASSSHGARQRRTACGQAVCVSKLWICVQAARPPSLHPAWALSQVSRSAHHVPGVFHPAVARCWTAASCLPRTRAAARMHLRMSSGV